MADILFDAGTMMDKPIDSIPVEYLEIEHKFILDETFDKKSFVQKVNDLRPKRTTKQRVKDTYYVASGARPFIYRHRYDQELQQLTVKGIGQGTESRLEINLDLGQHAGNQAKDVAAFLSTAGISLRGAIQKDIEVFHFDDCEIVYYAATDGKAQVHCVEFEAHGAKSMDAGLKVVFRYETLLGFDPKQRGHQSLFEIFFPELPTEENH